MVRISGLSVCGGSLVPKVDVLGLHISLRVEGEMTGLGLRGGN